MQGHNALSLLGKGKDVRIGTYGDGGAVPKYIWDSLIQDARKHTAYCHQYDNPNSSFDPTMYMVSADNLATAKKHWDFGHRTFRVIQDVNEVVKGQEIKTVNITDKISKRDAELVSEMVANALIDMGIMNVEDEDPSFPFVYSWDIKVDYEENE
jgi:hypothetical protein